ncbi:hypothetical protein G6F64_015493 [Rhizopus arrhizus]|uniref:Uncharacterized protein n=1 Tax=Rhizopus oryzae TaxID=64495 RepID=A0A9P6WS62_RHIOR|nr:hypothetical protein G6F64_015493 [Rhizopus arrhizus]
MVCCTGLPKLLAMREALTSIGASTVGAAALAGSRMMALPSRRARNGVSRSKASRACSGVIVPDTACACMPATACGV